MNHIVSVNENLIILLIQLDRPFTAMDRINRTGLSDFLKVLHENKWADENGVAIKNFTISNSAFDKDGVSFLEWTARLEQSNL